MEKTLKLQKLQQKLEYKQRVEKYISLFDTVCQISPYYPCSPECRAYCCKITPINFSRIAYNEVVSLGKKYKHIMETETEAIPKEFQRSVRGRQHVEVRRFKSEVCPLLENNRCSIYECRPSMCRPYPFRQNESCGFDVVVCPSGLDIIIDDFTVSMLNKALNVKNKEVLAETITIAVNNIIPIIKDEENVRSDMSGSVHRRLMLYDCYTILPKLLAYLTEVSEERRLDVRKSVLKILKDCANNQINIAHAIAFFNRQRAVDLLGSSEIGILSMQKDIIWK